MIFLMIVCILMGAMIVYTNWPCVKKEEELAKMKAQISEIEKTVQVIHNTMDLPTRRLNVISPKSKDGKKPVGRPRKKDLFL